MHFTFQGMLTSTPGMANYDPGVTWDDCVVFGIQQSPAKIIVNGQSSSSFSYDAKQQVRLFCLFSTRASSFGFFSRPQRAYSIFNVTKNGSNVGLLERGQLNIEDKCSEIQQHTKRNIYTDSCISY